MDSPKPEYGFEADGAFVIRHYNVASPFSSFLPGIAGAWGIPMWVFYVNRGQGVCSFGVRDKDHALLEFLSANWAYQLAFRQGFQTFLKIRSGKELSHHEPFQAAAAQDPGCVQSMRVTPWDVTFSEAHTGKGLQTSASYFTLPDETLPALVRTVRIRNTTGKPMSLQMLDGLAQIIPNGLNNFSLKEMRYIAQAHVEVTGLGERTPGFRTKATTDDSTVVEEVSAVNFCFGYEENSTAELLQPIVDPAAAYGSTTDLSRPDRFLRGGEFRLPARQLTENQIPSALLLAEFTLAPGQERTFRSFYGHARNLVELSRFAQRARAADYVRQKEDQNRRLIQKLTQGCATVSSHSVLNAYARQNLLDNLMRGGWPTTLRGGDKPVVLSLYTRKHGDLERDYNYYIIEPTPFSQGESNYRDVNQNRRHDVFMNPDVGADHIVFFSNMIQADGFNPLLVRPKLFACKDTPALRSFLRKAVGRRADDLAGAVTREFELGRLLLMMIEKNIELVIPREAFVEGLVQFTENIESSEYGHGFWSDHWTYNQDLIDAFAGIFPERMADLLFKRRDFVYCDSFAFVKPRSEKYVLIKGRPAQLDSVAKDSAKEAMIRARTSRRFAMRTKHGKGIVYTTTLAPKLLALAAVKLASLDSHGKGIELETDRPNWNDALNGLPGQFGSSTCETFELKRLLRLLLDSLDLAPKSFRWKLPIEIHDLMSGLDRLLRARSQGSQAGRAFAFWDKASSLKEAYRKRIRMGFAGAEKALTTAQARDFLERALAKVNAGLLESFDRKTGLYQAYFRCEVTRYKAGPKVGAHISIKPLAFKQTALPAFLEAQVHALRVEKDAKKARDLVRAVRQSGLYDATLNMYKVNANLEVESKGIGRIRTFARGWLENESIWLHMEYKYLLEMLRSGLHPEFFDDFRTCATPFLSPETYRRSPTENSSFLASDAYPDKELVGKGFMARLSGATAEFVHMWILMCCGERPFRLGDRGELEAVLAPVIPSWLFTTKEESLELIGDDGSTRAVRIPASSFAFIFLGHTVVTYVQDGAPRDTFGTNPARIASLRLTYDDGREAELAGAVIPQPHAEALRSRRIREITAKLA